MFLPVIYSLVCAVFTARFLNCQTKCKNDCEQRLGGGDHVLFQVLF
jgi:hypothetical protein